MISASSAIKILRIKRKDFAFSFLHAISTSAILRLKRKKYKKKTLMSLDLHTSVSRDMEIPLTSHGIDLDRWTISAHSYLFKEPNLRTAHIRNKNWTEIDHKTIMRFLNRYGLALNGYAGYLVTHTFSFLQIFEELQKPILAINSTRYESPYTLQRDKYYSLNQSIQRLSGVGQLTIVSNNAGDREYLTLLSGIESEYIPNLCDYAIRHNPQSFPWIIHCRDTSLANMLASQINNAVTQGSAFPNGFTHEQFSKFAGVILIPYNISTMRLFELTTAGFPVRIPSDRLLKEWATLPGVLSELSWLQVYGAECPDWLLGTPADPNWEEFLDWWLARADWNNTFYFPNVTRFDSIEELNSPPATFRMEDIELRNLLIKTKWDEAISRFAKKIY